jgi:hypothetical protein
MALQRLLITKTDGTEVTVTPCLADTLNFERTLKNNPAWGSLQENQLKAGPFRAWSAGKREGSVTESWEEFANTCANVDVAPEPAAAAGDGEDLEVDGLGLGGLTTAPTTY